MGKILSINSLLKVASPLPGYSRLLWSQVEPAEPKFKGFLLSHQVPKGPMVKKLSKSVKSEQKEQS